MKSHNYLPPRCVCPCVFRTLDDSVYRIALSLAKRYNVPLWEVYMTHLEFLFTDSGYVHTHTHTEFLIPRHSSLSSHQVEIFISSVVWIWKLCSVLGERPLLSGSLRSLS